ncbi:hypothetical protein MJ579_05030 [Klebsiella pneumoniae]|nr:hypothetical protein MJ579_05030 [Klebsiella pneumoniae]
MADLRRRRSDSMVTCGVDAGRTAHGERSLLFAKRDGLYIVLAFALAR